MVLGMVGVPWETTLGQRSKHIPLEISEDGREVQMEDETNRAPDNDNEEGGNDMVCDMAGGYVGEFTIPNYY